MYFCIKDELIVKDSKVFPHQLRSNKNGEEKRNKK